MVRNLRWTVRKLKRKGRTNMKQSIKVIATLSLNNFGGIELLAIDTDDETVTWRHNYGEAQKTQTTELLFDDTSGDPYVIIDGNLHAIDEFLRTDI